jgi:prepilin-type N-terminal cleavage/methylation domain-containing protein
MKIKAFTLIEMLVSLLIGGIIMGLAWNVYFYLGGYQNLIEDKAEKQIDLKRIEYRMRRDLAYSMETRLNENVLIIIQMNDSIRYNFGDNELIRQSNLVADTVLIKSTISEYVKTVYQICLVQIVPNDYCFDVKIPRSSVNQLMATDENP